MMVMMTVMAKTQIRAFPFNKDFLIKANMAKGQLFCPLFLLTLFVRFVYRQPATERPPPRLADVGVSCRLTLLVLHL